MDKVEFKVATQAIVRSVVTLAALFDLTRQ
jgi:hypothetical protein